MGYQPNAVEPFPGDNTPDLRAILREVKQGCATQEKSLAKARELQDWYDGESEKYVAFKPAEDALSWLTRPKRVSFITRQAVNKLTSHLYKPGPRARRITTDLEVSAWYGRVAQDISLNGVMRQADILATLHGLCAIGVYPTGNPRRPINYHLFPRQDFVFWASPDDPRVPTAVCTITRMGESVRFRLWTASHYYTFFKGKNWGYTPGGWNVTRFDPASSGPHPYGVLPFCFITHELPTTDLETPGLGCLLAKVNRALNIDKSNLALWVHHYARPLGFVSGVGPEWRPKFIDGGFVPLVVRHDSTEDSPVIPEARYLESSFSIEAVHQYIIGEANQALAELDVPLTLAVQSDGGGGTMAQSGIAIAAHDADLITYAKGRRPLFERHEECLASLVCKVASGAGTDMGAALAKVAADPALRVCWAEVSIDLPGQARDQADQFELEQGLTDPIEVLMHRRGLSEPEAVEEFRGIARRRQLVDAILADPAAEVPEEADDGSGEPEIPEDTGEYGSDMGVVNDGPSLELMQAQNVSPSIKAVVVVSPQEEMPIGPLIIGGPGYGGWGTES